MSLPHRGCLLWDRCCWVKQVVAAESHDSSLWRGQGHSHRCTYIQELGLLPEQAGEAEWDGAFTDPVFNLMWHWVQAKLQVPEKRIKMKQNDVTSLRYRLKGQSRGNSEWACHLVAVLGFGQCVLLTLLCNLSLQGLERVLRVNKAAVTRRHSMPCPVLTPFMW